ncbi:MAG TPA: hypothetical protein VFF24_15745 [Acidimicrobiia bacterium]|nr:hypothetical protein [Acidimicrobiia bacterium]
MALVPAALLGGLLALSPLAPAKAASEVCTDNWPSVSVQLVSGTLGLPLWLGVESGVLDGQPGHVGLCYGTGAPGDSKTAGGHASVSVLPSTSGSTVDVHNWSDSNAAIGANVAVVSQPTYTVSPGGAGGGQALTFTIPVAICAGPCHPGTQPLDGTNGVIVGTISPTSPPSGGTSASYRVTNLCVKVDGATVLGNCDAVVIGDTGVTTTGTDPVNTSPATPGPCVVGLCAPNYNYIGTTGNQLATVYVHGLGPVPVYGVHTCLYQKDASTPCPT